MIQELERVALTVDLPIYHLEAGDMGTVVDITEDGEEYTIEFFTLDGETFAVVPVSATQIRRVGSREIAHARMMEG
ncbi:MAG: DUF4926 domain-containing protein [Anaerolineae bacterium]|nr:DUF4926 domain-containing protein [Anaerolineae bacterium]